MRVSINLECWEFLHFPLFKAFVLFFPQLLPQLSSVGSATSREVLNTLVPHTHSSTATAIQLLTLLKSLTKGKTQEKAPFIPGS